jgi:hypothetical protein
MSRLALPVLLAMLVAAPAAAQPSAAEPNQSVGGGVQWAPPYTGRGEAPGVQATWRRWLSPHWGIGTDVRWGRRTTTREIDTPEQPGPGGITIHAQQGREERRTSSQGFGVGLLARGWAGRTSFIAGVGPGLFVDRTTHETRINEWQDAGESTFRSVGLQGLLEVDIRATSRVSAFVGIRMEWRDVRDAEGSFGYPTAGLRFAF